jgi:hypothetical protein
MTDAQEKPRFPSLIAIAVGLFLSAAASVQVAAMDFLKGQECTMSRPSRALVHTRCVISGGIQGGTIDVSIKTPDDKVYALEGPIDGEEGHKFLLEHHPASKGIESDEWQCYRRNDAQLELCIAKLGSGKNPSSDGVNKVDLVGKQASLDRSALGCFVRDYDKSHLARHPNQLITNVKLAIRSPKGASPYRHEFALQVQMRGKDKILKTEGMCKEEGALKLHCFVECDGGGVDLSVKEDSVMMYLDRIRMASCGKDINDVEKAEEISGGLDDREFRIDRAGIGMCSNMDSTEENTSQQPQAAFLPTFSSYPAPLYNGRNALIVLSKEISTYRTRLIEASHSAPNFAGRFVLTSWGCGTSCLMGAVIDVSTGRATMLPFTICCSNPTNEQFRAINFRVDSRLIAFGGMRNEEEPMGTHYYEFDGHNFRFIKTVVNDGSFADASDQDPAKADLDAKGFTFRAQEIRDATNPSQSARLGEKISPQALKKRFAEYKVSYTKGEDCLTCAVLSGTDGQFEIDFAQDGRTIVNIRSSDNRSRDAHGNSIGSSLQKAIGAASALCDAGMNTTCASPIFKGLSYIVASDDRCPIALTEKLPTNIPACARIAGFQIQGD